jgi:hypothetical protein
MPSGCGQLRTGTGLVPTGQRSHDFSRTTVTYINIYVKLLAHAYRIDRCFASPNLPASS